eukprot:GEMP01021130.1.p1 GENE.GEMP01021130.1~~GEMP01021130.1.p1  ORF type:complete len:502 (+),score=108.58 GEMP01021130.1:227-1732(+)
MAQQTKRARAELSPRESSGPSPSPSASTEILPYSMAVVVSNTALAPSHVALRPSPGSVLEPSLASMVGPSHGSMVRPSPSTALAIPETRIQTRDGESGVEGAIVTPSVSVHAKAIVQADSLALVHHHGIISMDSKKARNVKKKATVELVKNTYFATEDALSTLAPLAREAKSVGWCINCFTQPAESSELCLQCDENTGMGICRYCRLMYRKTDFLKQYQLAGCVARSNTCMECAHLIYLKGFPKFCLYCKREAAWATSWTGGGDSMTQTNFRDIQFYCALCIEGRKRAAGNAVPRTCKKCSCNCLFPHARKDGTSVCINCDVVQDPLHRGVAYHMRDPWLNKYRDALLGIDARDDYSSGAPLKELRRRLVQQQAELKHKMQKKRDLESRLAFQKVHLPPPENSAEKRIKLNSLMVRAVELESLIESCDKFSAKRITEIKEHYSRLGIIGNRTTVRMTMNAERDANGCHELEKTLAIAKSVEEEEEARNRLIDAHIVEASDD